MLLEHTEFSKLIRAADFMKDVLCIIIDEAHCISQWGSDFRPKYGELEKLRSYVALNVPILATSATFTPTVLADIQIKLRYSPERTYLLNLGNDRHNITPLVIQMKGAAKDFAALDFVVDEAFADPPQALVRTLIYVNSKDLAHDTWAHLSNQLPTHLQDQIAYIHAGRSPRAKKLTMEQFRNGKIKILCATEVAGMVRGHRQGIISQHQCALYSYHQSGT